MRIANIAVVLSDLDKFGKVRLADDRVLVREQDRVLLIEDKGYTFEGEVLEVLSSERDLIRVINGII